jgi:hypothetical protein
VGGASPVRAVATNVNTPQYAACGLSSRENDLEKSRHRFTGR